MRKDLVLTAAISALVASTISVIAVFASGPGETFPDVDGDAYYADAVDSMRSLGVITGYEDGTFGPDDYVTRADLAVMLDRYDGALLEPPWPAVSGIYDLHQVVCLGGLDFDIESEGIQAAYDGLCDIP
ncbi:MAG: S-layer homology domain-containing protein [Candidatus Gracilibacteria bacterium]